MLAANRIALKEWAVVCAELAAGRQTILLRKGGIRERSRGFAIEHREFFLFPTYVHENEEELIEPARPALPEVVRRAPPAGELHLDLYAVVEAAFEVPTLAPLRRLEGHHILAWSAVERRFHYRRPGLHVIALRVFPTQRRAVASQIPMLLLMVLYTAIGLWVLSLPIAAGIPR